MQARITVKIMIEAKAARIHAEKNQTPYMVENQWYSNDLNQSIEPSVIAMAVKKSPSDDKRRALCVLLMFPVVSVSKDHLRNNVATPIKTAKIPMARIVKNGMFKNGDFQA